ncbi:Hint domain-containing protein [Pseudoroseicyclus sp. CXY001]|uniref:Hint domain-containing protein n=1 Tax=Pseudoroseicyclus sp. CXY001 TaxID=3242492 RepID=UPI003570A8F3
MTIPLPAVHLTADPSASQPDGRLHSAQITRADGRPQRNQPLLRKIEVACLDERGDIVDFTRLVPSHPVFDGAFSAVARGALLQTERGAVAIEDVLPGDRIRTGGGDFETLLWKGSTLIHAQARGQSDAMRRLIRIPADTLGIARPMADLVLGPAARIVRSVPGIRRLTGGDHALMPARDFIDDLGFIELTPQVPVPVYHLAFARHERVAVNGLEVESFHPGPAHALGLSGELEELLLSCFPHVSRLADFGATLMPRLRRADLDLIDVA